MDTWINDVAPSRVLFDRFEQEIVTWVNLSIYSEKMGGYHAQYKTKWIKIFPKKKRCCPFML